MPLFLYPQFFFSKSAQTSEILKNQYSLPCGFVCMMGLLHTHTHKVLVCNFVADYNLGSIKMKPNIFLKNEHSCVQQEIALASLSANSR